MALVTRKVAEDPPVQKNDLGALASGAKEMEREFASHRIKILLPNTSIQNFDERGKGKMAFQIRFPPIPR